MKIYLDDERSTPDGWTRCFWPDEVINLLHTENVSEVSLDHDLGDDDRGTGYDVLLWIEEAVLTRGYTPPKLSVHSANISARQKMESAIAKIEKFIRTPTDFSRHQDKGQFLISWGGTAPAAYIPKLGVEIELKNSAHISNFYELGDETALGVDYSWQCYRQEFLEAGWRRPLHPQPMAIWDLTTGKRQLYLEGHHLGKVCGAALLGEGRLITWGRDYLIRVWDRHTGKCLGVMPLPLFADAESGEAVLSNHDFGKMQHSEKQRYVDDRHLPAPDVQIDWIVVPEGEQRSFKCRVENRSDQNQVTQWVPTINTSNGHCMERIKDITGAEASYSTWLLLDDGRLLGGGTTYGTSGYIYVWDGLYDLRILHAGRASINLEITGEVAPNVVETQEPLGVDAYDTYRFKV